MCLIRINHFQRCLTLFIGLFADCCPQRHSQRGTLSKSRTSSKGVSSFSLVQDIDRYAILLNYFHIAQVYFASDDVRACIVTCGGLCPGLNTVIREIVHSLDYMYGVNQVLGIDVSWRCIHFEVDQYYHLSFMLAIGNKD